MPWPGKDGQGSGTCLPGLLNRPKQTCFVSVLSRPVGVTLIGEKSKEVVKKSKESTGSMEPNILENNKFLIQMFLKVHKNSRCK